jgi:hypothetical protein
MVSLNHTSFLNNSESRGPAGANVRLNVRFGRELAQP